jgi:hypothetical protein
MPALFVLSKAGAFAWLFDSVICLLLGIVASQHSVHVGYSSVSPSCRQPALCADMCFAGDVLLVGAVW